MSDKPYTNRPAGWEIDEATELKTKLAALKAIMAQKPIEIERHEPLAGQLDFLANEPGPDATFKLTSGPKKKRRKS